MSDSWKETTIGQCLLTSFAGEWGTEPKPGNALVFRATDIDNEGRIVGSGALRQLPIGKLSAKKLLDGDILIEGSGGSPDKPVGRVAYFTAAAHLMPATCSNFFKTLRPACDQIAPRFLLHKLSWFYKQAPMLALQQQTTGIINLKFAEYLESAIAVPNSSKEQTKIAQILDTLDTTIHETEAIIAKLKAVKQGLLYDLLSRGIDANGELRPPQADAPHLYKTSPLGWIPKDWEASALGTVTDWTSGGTPNRAIASNWIGDVPILTPKDMKFFELPDTSEHISFRAAATGSRLMPPETVFIVVRGMILAHSFPVVISTRAMAFNQDIKAVTCGPYLNNRFLAHWFVANSDHFLRKVTEATHGTKKLDTEHLLGMPIGVPPLSEQVGIVARQMAIADQLDRESLAVAGLKALKSGLMDDLLTGRVRVTPLLEGSKP